MAKIQPVDPSGGVGLAQLSRFEGQKS